MTNLDITKCPNCGFCAIFQELISYLNSDNNKCPMCEEEINPQLINKLEDPINYLKSRKIASLEMLEKEAKSK